MKTIEELKQSLIKRIKRDGKAYTSSNNITDYLNDVTTHGCITGMVNGLIYYNDTVKFYRKHKDLINEMLEEALANVGSNDPKDVFGDKWEDDDPLALERFNQNLLAWFCYEEVARELLDEIEAKEIARP